MAIDTTTPSHRGDEILAVFSTAFGALLAADPAAFQTKFRKMAASAFAFYRGTASLFYHDLEAQAQIQADPFLNDQSSNIWIHGDLHAENFGTYMDSHGRLIFNVNDFDEAYVGPFTWDVKRFAASIALLGYAKALSDRQITRLVKTYAAAYHERIRALATTETHDIPRITLDTAKGPLLDALHNARMQTRVSLLDSQTEIHNFERRFTLGGGAIELDDTAREKVIAAFDNYLTTLPQPQSSAGSSAYRVKDVVGRRGVGIGSAGLPSFNILLEGKSEAVENDVIIYMKQSIPAAVSRHVTNVSAASYFLHEGHRTVVSQRALQACADPWLGWTEIDGVGQLVAEVSPYAVDLDWSEINDISEMAEVVADLGRATAMMHAAGDDDKLHSALVPFSPEQAINQAIDAAGGKEAFAEALVDFAHAYGARARGDHQIFVDLFRNGRIPGLELYEEE
ncbi:hypothetical protein BDW74DRAFT_160512 [Aspergillus multicolor]|uniref:DUF2252 domain-containing protein n=1 Tax=Aspergillus multicolor TaxID=41759 RepID=UPI003CCD3666